MRRSDREIKEFDKIVEVMRKCDFCRVAINDEKYPYILPLNFGMDVIDGKITLYFHGANEGKKYELLEKNNYVSFEMDCEHQLITDDDNHSCTMEYESVIGYGRIKIMKEEEKYDALVKIMRQYHKEDFPFGKEVIPMTTLMKLEVDEVTGKRRKKNPHK